MKKLLLLLCALVALYSIAENRTMFVHHGEDIDVFLFSSVDSMRVSSIDIDSINMGSPVVQEIWLADSVYRYPIAEIDSITFQSPQTIVVSGAVDLALELDPYILGFDETDGLVLKLSSNTPNRLVPTSGTCIYQLNPSEALPYGFAARVNEVVATSEEIKLKCVDADIEEIFEQLAWTSISAFEPESENKEYKFASSRAEDYNPEYWLASTTEFPDLVSGVITMTDELRDIPVGPVQAQIRSHIAIHPLVTCTVGKYVLPVADGNKISLTKMHSSAITSVKATAQGRQIIKESKTIGSDNKLSFNLPLGLGQKCTLTYVGTMSLKGTMGVDFGYTGKYSSVINTSVYYTQDGSARVESNCKHTPLSSNNYSVETSMDGNLTLTGSLSFTHTQVGDSLKSLTHTISYGASLKGDALFKTSDYEGAKTNNGLYKKLTNTGIRVKPVESVSVTAKYSDQKLKPTLTITKSDSLFYFVIPKFTSVEYDKNSHVATYTMAGVPMNFSNSLLGVAVENKDKQFSWKSTEQIWPKDSRTTFKANINFDSSSGETLYPTVTMPTGERILAAPQYPYVSNCIFPITSVGHSSGVSITSGAPIIGSATSKDKKTIVVVGNMFIPKEKKDDKDKDKNK